MKKTWKFSLQNWNDSFKEFLSGNLVSLSIQIRGKNSAGIAYKWGLKGISYTINLDDNSLCQM